MEKLGFNIESSYTAARKPKRSLLPEGVFSSLKDKHCNIRKEACGGILGRRISSAVVVRTPDCNPEQIKPPSNDTDSLQETSYKNGLPSLGHCILSDDLRTPNKRLKKMKINASQENRMTRNCASLFTQMSAVYKPEVHPQIDPRYSVQGLIKKSGLKLFSENKHWKGSDAREIIRSDGLLGEPSNTHQDQNSNFFLNDFQLKPDNFQNLEPENNDISSTLKSEDFIAGLVPHESPISYSYPSPISPKSDQTRVYAEDFQSTFPELQETTNSSVDESLTTTPSFNPETSPSQLSYKSVGSTSTEQQSLPKRSPEVRFETVVLQKTIAMELTEYLPNDKEWTTYSPHESQNLRSDENPHFGLLTEEYAREYFLNEMVQPTKSQSLILQHIMDIMNDISGLLNRRKLSSAE